MWCLLRRSRGYGTIEKKNMISSLCCRRRWISSSGKEDESKKKEEILFYQSQYCNIFRAGMGLMLTQWSAQAFLVVPLLFTNQEVTWSNQFITGISLFGSTLGVLSLRLFSNSVVHSMYVESEENVSMVSVYPYTVFGGKSKSGKRAALRSCELAGETSRYLAVRTDSERRFNFLVDTVRGQFEDQVMSESIFKDSLRKKSSTPTDQVRTTVPKTIVSRRSVDVPRSIPSKRRKKRRKK